MQGSNTGRIKMARQKLRFDDDNWGGHQNHLSNGKSSKKVKHKSNKPTHKDKNQPQ